MSLVSMKSFFTYASLFFLLSLFDAFAQEEEWKLTLLDQWPKENALGAEKSTLQQYFNDVWGWTSPDNREYAIIGSLDSTFFFDITNPSAIEKVDAVAGRYDKCVHRDFKTWKHYAYGVADEGNSSLQIFDLSYLPDSVHVVYDSNELILRAHNIYIENERLYVATHTTKNGRIYPMSVFSLENPVNPELLSHFNPTPPFFSFVHDVHVLNDTAYCSMENLGYFIYDFTDPVNYELIAYTAHYPQQGYNHSSWLFHQNGNRYGVFADENHGLGLKMVELSDLNNVFVSNVFGLPDYRSKRSIAHNPFVLDDSLCYVAYYHDGVQVFNVKNPQQPFYLTSYDTYPAFPNASLERRTGYAGCWGVYPFFPSGTVIASDMSFGLHVMRLELERQEEQPLSIKASPNPFQQELMLSWNHPPQAERVRLSWINLSGRILNTKTVNLANGQQTLVLSTEGLPNGFYLLKVEMRGLGVEVLKVLKQN